MASPDETGKNYDLVAQRWVSEMQGSSYGLPALERALSFAKPGRALDVGCGGEARFLRALAGRKFKCIGVDNSAEMIALASANCGGAELFTADISLWDLAGKFEFISAWDSTFHLPLESQEPVLRKLCAGLCAGGILLFTCGGGEKPGEKRGEFLGCEFEYSTLGVPGFLRVLEDAGCGLLHLEYDQFPENHVTMIAQKL